MRIIIMDSFQSLGVPQQLVQRLESLNFNTPTPVQAEAIPLAIAGHDILGSAQTGTGKTMAFGIPLLAKLLSDPNSIALVITPTRELATQVMQAFQQLLGRNSPIKTALLIGGESIVNQFRQLRAKPRLFVGTPGRINDHLTRGKLRFNQVRYLVLDETDRMLDMGFSVQINKILEHLPNDRQTLLFSATLPKNIMKLAGSYLRDPKRVAIQTSEASHKRIKQDVKRMRESDKYPELLTQLEERDGTVIVFVKTKYGADRLASKLSRADYSADAIHGDLRHSKRERVIKAFRNKQYRILVATDIAARGIDIPHIEHVINYDLPQCAEDYVHRIGRTARAGAEGSAMCFVTPADGRKWSAIERLMNPGQTKSKPPQQRHKRYSSHNKRPRAS